MVLVGRGILIVIGIAMLAIGGAKIARVPKFVDNMAKIHFTGTLLTLVGLGEVSAAILTLLPWTRNLGALGLMGAFVGAIGSHMGAGQHPKESVPAGVALAVAAIGFALANPVLVKALLLP